MDRSPDQRRIGQRINETYEPLELLLSTEATACYRARDLRDQKTVTLTLLRPELALRQQALQGFKSKAEKLKKLAHEGVPAVLAVESDETGIPFAVEVHHRGEKLSAMASRNPQGLPLDEALKLVLPVMETMAEAHAAGLVHGRLSLDNVVLTDAGGTGSHKVIHFLGCYTAPGTGAGTRGEGARSFSETPEHAPECVKGSLPDARSDVWSLGVMLFKILSGKFPLQTGSSERGDSVRVKIRSLAEVSPALPAEICRVVDSCIKIRPGDRLPDATALGERLLPALRNAATATGGRQAKPATAVRAQDAAGKSGPVGRAVPARASRGGAANGGGSAAASRRRAQGATDALRAQKARELVRQIAKDSQLGLRSGSAPLPGAGAGRSTTPSGHNLAHKIARILYTPITLDLVTDRGGKGGNRPGVESTGRRAAGKGEPARAASGPSAAKGRETPVAGEGPGAEKARSVSGGRAAAGPRVDPSKREVRADVAGSEPVVEPPRAGQPGPVPDRSAKQTSDGDLAGMMSGEDLAALLNDSDMADLLDADDLAVPMERDDLKQKINYGRPAAMSGQEGAAESKPAPIDDYPPVDYRIPIGRTLLRVALYGICLLAIAGSYIFYREVVSEQGSTAVSMRRGFAWPTFVKSDDDKARPEPGAVPSPRTPEQEEMGDVEAVRQARERFKKPLFGQ
jgi:hypothetical protein